METIENTHSAVGEILTSSAACTPEATVNEVADRFFRTPDTDAVAVVLDEVPLGLVTRQKFLATVFRRFGWELYGRKPVSSIADTTPLVVSSETQLDEALNLAMKRAPDDAYDDLVVIDADGRFKGLLSVRQMVIRHSHMLANTMLQRDLADARASEMERVSELKGQFLTHVTHELRSPVNAIIELGEMIRLAAESGYVNQVRDRLSLLLSSATNLRSVITNILDLSKIEAGRMRVFVEEFDLIPVLEEVVETTRVLRGSKPVEVRLHAPTGGVPMMTDPVKLRQIVLNLTSNAAKFTDEGAINITAEAAGDRAIVRVSDSGIGIRQEDLERLFAPFTQLEDAKTKMHQGTGLGLAITRSLIDLLGGQIRVESEFEKGTEFTVSIPVTYEENEDAKLHTA